MKAYSIQATKLVCREHAVSNNNLLRMHGSVCCGSGGAGGTQPSVAVLCPLTLAADQ